MKGSATGDLTTAVEGLSPAPPVRRRDRFDDFAGVQRLAKRRLPRSQFEEVAGGTGQARTLAANLQAFDEVKFRPFAAAARPERDLATTVLGLPLSMPLLLDPVGGLRVLHPAGAKAAARAAAGAGTAAAVSMSAGHSLTEVRAALGEGPILAQLYMFEGRERAEQVIAEAVEQRCHALVVTVDCGVNPKSHSPLGINLQTATQYGPELVTRPGWLLRFIRDGVQLGVANSALGIGRRQEIYSPLWDDFKWIREAWPGPLVIKGVVRPDDARRAVDHGAAAVIVSNHGGLALDGEMGTMRALPGVVDAVGGSAEILLDGGVRDGGDVLKALALGARAVLFGRPYAMALAVGGEPTVRHLLELFRTDINRTLALIGANSVSEMNPSFVDVPHAHNGLPS